MDDPKKLKKEKEEELVWEKDEEEEEKEKSASAKASADKEEKVEQVEEEMDEEEDKTEEEEKDEGESVKEEEEETVEESEKEEAHEDISRSESLRHDLNKFVRDNQPNYNLTPQNKRISTKLITLILFIVAVLVIGGGIYFIAGLGSAKKQPQSSSDVPTATPRPTPTPQAVNRSDWSFEVLNGSGVTGEAKRIADALKELGYQVVKVGNADRSDYTQSEFFVQEDLTDKVDQVVVDIKDIIKIASISGELKDSTASARIIIGKE